MGKIFLNNVLGMTMEEAESLSNEEWEQLLTVNLTTPNKEKVELYYTQIKSNEMNVGLYNYSISQSGNYTFKATNSKGRNSEITVPVEIDENKIKTFTLKTSESETETKTFSFVEGQTWEDFIGESGKVIIDGVNFKNTGNTIEFWIFTLALIDGEDRIGVSPTDKIVEDGIYSASTWVW